jgi:tRNA(Ile)-lysidine synthase TilS/MesJ/rhodanese-related sulfurtransferase
MMDNIIIELDDLKDIDFSGVSLADIRPREMYSFGTIPGAVNIPSTIGEMQGLYALPRDKKVYIFCQSGEISGEITERLRADGYDAYHLKVGYLGYLKSVLEEDASADSFDAERCAKIERSIIKTYRKSIWRKFIKGINTYKMINEGDKIAVCISGGKDSMLMAKCIQEIHRHGVVHFDAEYLVMDPGYNPVNRQRIIDNAKTLNIPIHIFQTNIFDSVANVDDHPCYLCARMRRGYLYKEAQRLGCNKIALGHHFDDVIETILMGMLYGAQIQTMMPKLHSTNHPGMELIRPLYMVKEKDIIAWARLNDLQFIQCACRFTDNCTSCNSEVKSKRQEMKELIKQFRKTSPYIEKNIFNSVQNVNLTTIIGYHNGDKEYNFLDDYDERGGKS